MKRQMGEKVLQFVEKIKQQSVKAVGLREDGRTGGGKSLPPRGTHSSNSQAVPRKRKQGRPRLTFTRDCRETGAVAHNLDGVQSRERKNQITGAGDSAIGKSEKRRTRKTAVPSLRKKKTSRNMKCHL